MSNIYDYLDWRGDIEITADGFNEVDNLILSVISYIDFSNIIPPEPKGGGITLREAEIRLAELHKAHQDLGLIIPEQTSDFVNKASKTARFGNIKLYSYIDKIDSDIETQFSALTFALPDRSLFVAFRGTDDTLVGWKENFNMSFASPVPAQISAADYLADIAGNKWGKIRIGGHSKGGNLAIWAAVNAPKRVQKRIIAAYNNDGPGFMEELTRKEEYIAVENRLFTFVPESSVVGLLLEHSESYSIVKSSQNTIWQHDPFSWEILGKEFIKADKLSSFSKRTDKALTGWISSMTPEERKHTTDVLFDILESTGAKTLTDVSSGLFKNFGSMLRSFTNIDKTTKDNLALLVKKIIEFNSPFGK